MTTVWPRDLLVPETQTVKLVPRSVSGTIASSGFRQVVASDAGGWMITLNRVMVYGETAIRKWHEIALLTEGRLNPLLVPVWPTFRPAEAAFFTDGTGHDLDADVSATVNASASLRATTIAINVSYGGALAPGDYFSISERLYQIRSVVSVVGSVNTVTIRPGLRGAMSGGETVDLNTPHCRMRLTQDSMEMDLGSVGARPSISFIEDPV